MKQTLAGGWALPQRRRDTTEPPHPGGFVALSRSPCRSTAVMLARSCGCVSGSNSRRYHYAPGRV